MKKPAEIKTKAHDGSVADFIQSVPDAQKRADCQVLIDLMQTLSGEAPKLWGSAIIGFGIKRYESPKTGRQVDWFKIGFSPRKANISLHLVLNLKAHASLLNALGKHKAGVGCLYVNSLADIDIQVLQQLVKAALEDK